MKRVSINLCLASVELIIAAMLWGFGFIGVVWALKVWTPLELVFLRMLIGASIGMSLSALVRRKKLAWRSIGRLAIVPAIWLALMLFFQTWGLAHTTATKSGFITILYIVLVPIFAAFFENRKTPMIQWLCILLALFGVFLIVDFSFETPLNLGDGLTFICAVAAAMHIIAIDKVSHEMHDAFFFNSMQSAWCGLMAAAVYFGNQGLSFPTLSADSLAWIGLLSTALGGTLIAFYLQVRAQRTLSPTAASLFFLLESPFAMLFAFIILKEHLTVRAMFGATLIMLAAFFVTLAEAKRKRLH